MKVSRFFLLSFLLMYFLLGFTISNAEGETLIQRTPLGGLHAQGSPGNENVDVLSSEVFLVDENLDSSTGIDLSNDQFNNVGIWVSSDETVDRLYIYVNQNVTSDAALTNAANWKLYKSDFNQGGTWTEHSIAAVSVSAVNSIDNIYRYEITFVSQHSASFFKAVNMVTSDVLDVSVTEIEAYGTDIAINIDIKPGGEPNSINPRSKGIITVAILSTDTFDATQVDISTLAFGPAGAAIAHIGHFEDIDNDGDFDLVMHFRTQETGITCGDTGASLTGETLDGQTIIGIDAIKMVGCKQVLDEEITLKFGDITLLENNKVDLNSIRVFDVSRSILFINGIDYIATEIDLDVQVSCVAGGLIDVTLDCSDGALVLVDYIYIQ